MLYSKYINGKLTIKNEKEIIVLKDNKQIINPSHEMILNDGWLVYIVPKDELLEEKKKMIDLILKYDSSDMVNIFHINGIPVWIDKATRVGLKLRFEAEIQNHQYETTLWYNGQSFRLDLEGAIHMLNSIEIYASKCYDNTQRHISIVNSLNNIDDIKNYNYQDGYPEQLIF